METDFINTELSKQELRQAADFGNEDEDVEDIANDVRRGNHLIVGAMYHAGVGFLRAQEFIDHNFNLYAPFCILRTDPRRSRITYRIWRETIGELAEKTATLCRRAAEDA